MPAVNTLTRTSGTVRVINEATDSPSMSSVVGSQATRSFWADATATAIQLCGGAANTSTLLRAAAAGTVSVGENTVAQTVNLGSTSGASATTVRSGTGGLAVTASGVTSIGFTTNSLSRSRVSGDGAQEWVGIVTASAPAVSSANEARFYYDTTANEIMLSKNTAAYAVFGAGGASGWTDDGSVVRLTTAADGCGIGIAAIAATSKLEVLGDATRLDLLFTAGNPGGASTGGALTGTAGQGGVTGIGGSLSLAGGPGGSTSGDGGQASFAGGSSTSGPAGAVIVFGGTCSGTGQGGLTEVYGGTGGVTGGLGGDLVCAGGFGATAGAGDGYFVGGDADAGTNGGDCFVSGGNSGASGGTPGNLYMEAGNESAAEGGVPGGLVQLTSGAPFDGGGFASGSVTIGSFSTSGFSNEEPSGALFLGTGPAAGASGLIQITTGNAEGAAVNSGALTVSTGNVTVGDGESGAILVFTGTADGASPTGDIEIFTGDQGNEGGVDSGHIRIFPGSSGATVGTLHLLLASTQRLQFFANTTGAVKQTATGSRGGNAALASLLTALATYGLITDSTTA